MQQHYQHGVPKDRRVMRAVDSMQQQLCRQQQDSIENFNMEPVVPYCTQYQRLVIVLRCGKYQEYKIDSGQPISQEVLQQTANHVHNKHKITFGDIPNKLTEGGIYRRQHLLDMQAHVYVLTDTRILVSIH